MTNPKSGHILKAMQQQAHRGRGLVYCWLRANHQEIQSGFAQTDASWNTVVAIMVGDGVTGRHGSVPNRRSTAKVWDRVCRDLRQEAVERLTDIPARKRQPSQMPVNWRPPVAEPPRAPAAPRAELPHQTRISLLDAKDLPDDVKENLAALERQFAWADRFVNPPKRKD